MTDFFPRFVAPQPCEYQHRGDTTPRPSHYQSPAPTVHNVTRRLPSNRHGTFIGPGPLNGKTALLIIGTRGPGLLLAQFDDRTLLQPGLELRLDSPWWAALGFGWHLFQSRFWRIE